MRLATSASAPEAAARAEGRRELGRLTACDVELGAAQLELAQQLEKRHADLRAPARRHLEAPSRLARVEESAARVSVESGGAPRRLRREDVEPKRFEHLPHLAEEVRMEGVPSAEAHLDETDRLSVLVGRRLEDDLRELMRELMRELVREEEPPESQRP